MPTEAQRLDSLESWRQDLALELRELEEWVEKVRPFLEQLEADLIYRQRRHAESVGRYSTTAKVLAAVCGLVIALTTVGGFVLELILLAHSSSGHG